MIYNCGVALLQAYGMSVLPLNLIKGTRSVAYERLENTEDMDDVEHQIENLKSKVCVTARLTFYAFFKYITVPKSSHAFTVLVHNLQLSPHSLYFYLASQRMHAIMDG